MDSGRGEGQTPQRQGMPAGGIAALHPALQNATAPGSG